MSLISVWKGYVEIREKINSALKSLYFLAYSYRTRCEDQEYFKPIIEGALEIAFSLIWLTWYTLSTILNTQRRSLIKYLPLNINNLHPSNEKFQIWCTIFRLGELIVHKT
ncbi:hypothetical protein BpHYR1_011554 [Brachionus plicatilis]|uniref:Uncharacterized protein n=1 Tax=Brachionus plicatilis TaxID=10195 RepID=A0A3M7SRL7_BRAPC|nr:hypothetical protein BpHYR1_011554 [Brachionus plicatilis]